MKYRLWDTDINRLHGTFDREAEALSLVSTLLRAYGEAYADDLMLGCEHDDCTFSEPITGAALVVRAGQFADERVAVAALRRKTG